MAFYFRKSINLGLLRLNFSKSGIGVSVGVKGARLSTGPRGTYVNVGANGLYYRQRIDTPQSSQNSHEFSSYDLTTFTTANVDELVDASGDETLAQLNARIAQLPFAPLFAVFAFGGAAWVFFISAEMGAAAALGGLLCSWLIYRGDVEKRTTPFFYNLEREAEERFVALQEALAAMSRSACLWRVEAKKSISDWKRNAGAGELVRRRTIKAGCFSPPFIATNVEVWGINLGNLRLFFFPDRLFVLQGKRYGVVPYDELQVSFMTTEFIEGGGVPHDAHIAHHTWQYVRRDGGPDLRFSSNKRIPVALYGHVALRCSTGLNIQLHVSNYAVAEGFASVFTQMRRFSFTEDFDRTAREEQEKGKAKQQEKSVPPSAEKEKSPYEILGLQEGATAEEISAAYRRLAQQYHPDKVAHLAPEFQALAETRMREINEANAALKSGNWQEKSQASEDDPYGSVAYCREALRRNSYDVKAHNGLFVYYLGQRLYAQALPHVQAMVGLAANSGEVRACLGMLYVRMGRTDDAIREYHTLINIDAEEASELWEYIHEAKAAEEIQDILDEKTEPQSSSFSASPRFSWKYAFVLFLIAGVSMVGWMYRDVFFPPAQTVPPVKKQVERKVSKPKKPVEQKKAEKQMGVK